VAELYSELKEDVGQMDVLVTRSEAMGVEFNNLCGFIIAGEARGGNMVQYLEKLDPGRPAEGQTIMGGFKVLCTELGGTKAYFAGHVAAVEDMKSHMAQHVASNEVRHEQAFSVIQSGSMGAFANAGLNAQHSKRLGDLTKTSPYLVQDVNVLKAAHATWDGKCHCVHVDKTTARLDNVEVVPRHSRTGDSAVPSFCGACGGAPAGSASLLLPPGLGSVVQWASTLASFPVARPS
jgi:hypothetical protein